MVLKKFRFVVAGERVCQLVLAVTPLSQIVPALLPFHVRLFVVARSTDPVLLINCAR